MMVSTLISKKSRFYILLFTASVVVGCDSSSTEFSTAPITISDTLKGLSADPEEDLLVSFKSDLRPDKLDWNLSEVFIDTLELIDVNTDYDYYFMLFKTRKGKEIRLNTDEVIDNYYQNRDFRVEWKVGEFHQAGEGDELYFAEEVISVERLVTSRSLENILVEFISAYAPNNKMGIEKFVNTKVEVVSVVSDHSNCLVVDREDMAQTKIDYEGLKIQAKWPKGDFCMGYPGVADGLYYEFIDELGLPVFDEINTETGEVSPYSLYIEPHVEYHYFAKVLFVLDEAFNRYLYFFNGDDTWYFWVEDLCSCEL